MRLLLKICLYSLFCFSLMAKEDVIFTGKPAKLLTFSEKIPINADALNQQLIQNDSSNEIQRNERKFQDKQFPLNKFLLGIFACLILFFLKKIPKTKAEKSLELITLKEKTIEKLKRLNLNASDFYEHVILILKNYLMEKYQIQAPYQTTEEFFHDLKQKKFQTEMSNEHLKKWLEFADLVKFGKKETSLEDRQSLLEEIITTISMN